MEPFATAFVDRLQELISSFQQTLSDVPAEALDWSPGPELNSLAVLATHSAAATRYLIGDMVGGVPSGRVRDAEFQTVGIDAAVLRQRLSDAAAIAEEIVAGLSITDLGSERFSPQHNRHFTVAWCMFHTLDHLAEHLGHAQMTRLLWEQRAGK